MLGILINKIRMAKKLAWRKKQEGEKIEESSKGSKRPESTKTIHLLFENKNAQKGGETGGINDNQGGPLKSLARQRLASRLKKRSSKGQTGGERRLAKRDLPENKGNKNWK